MKDTYYTYYSYEIDKGIDGLGYIGYRRLRDAPTPEEEDYFGTQKSPKNKAFKDNPNKSKIILGVFETRKEALAHEIYLHELWMVDRNDHFANQSRQKSKGFTPPLVPWNKGKPHSSKTRKNISKAKKGKPTWNKGKKTGQKVWNKGVDYKDNPQYVGEKLNWINEKTKEIILNASVKELCEMKPELRATDLYGVKTGRLKHTKKWKIITDNQQPD